METNTRWIVTQIYNFDPEVKSWEFDNYDKARAFIHWYWEGYLNEEFACMSEVDMDKTYHEDIYARVTWSDGDYTEFTLSQPYKSDEEFEKIDWKRYL